MSPLTDLGMGTIVVRGDGNQGRLWEAGTRSKVALCISVEGFDGSLLRSSAVLPTGSVLFLVPPHYSCSLLHMCVLALLCASCLLSLHVLVTMSFTWLSRVQPLLVGLTFNPTFWKQSSV